MDRLWGISSAMWHERTKGSFYCYKDQVFLTSMFYLISILVDYMHIGRTCSVYQISYKSLYVGPKLGDLYDVHRSVLILAITTKARE